MAYVWDSNWQEWIWPKWCWFWQQPKSKARKYRWRPFSVLFLFLSSSVLLLLSHSQRHITVLGYRLIHSSLSSVLFFFLYSTNWHDLGIMELGQRTHLYKWGTAWWKSLILNVPSVVTTTHSLNLSLFHSQFSILFLHPSFFSLSVSNPHAQANTHILGYLSCNYRGNANYFLQALLDMAWNGTAQNYDYDCTSIHICTCTHS